MYYTVPAALDDAKAPAMPVAHDDCDADVRVSQTPWALTEIDQLTGLPNRYCFLKRMEIIRDCHHTKSSVACLLLIRSAKFEFLNRTYGYSTADTYIYTAAQRLIGIIDDILLIGRFSPEEFAVVPKVHFIDEDEAQVFCSILADRIQKTLNELYRVECSCDHVATPYGMESLLLEGEFAIGMSFFGQEMEPLHHVFHRATKALEYTIKTNHSTVSAVKQKDYDSAGYKKTMSLVRDIHVGDFAKDLVQYYQLQVDQNGFIVGAECLVRWMHPRLGLLLPVEFMEIAEQSQAIVDLGYQMIDLACTTLKRWAKASHTQKLRLSVNVSPRQFHQPSFISSVNDILSAHQINRQLLRFEITECTVIHDVAEVIETMKRLKAMGISMSIDDFGTGYSSLTYIQRLPIDEIKIDRSFVSDIENDKRSRTIVQTIMSMARELKLEVVTEGVETIEQRNIIDSIGRTLYQGYLINKPMPINEVEQIIRHKHGRPVNEKFESVYEVAKW